MAACDAEGRAEAADLRRRLGYAALLWLALYLHGGQVGAEVGSQPAVSPPASVATSPPEEKGAPSFPPALMQAILTLSRSQDLRGVDLPASGTRVVWLQGHEGCQRLAVLPLPGSRPATPAAQTIRNVQVCDGQVQVLAATASRWQPDAAAEDFVRRVIQLAHRYGESSGLDPAQFMVRVRALGRLGEPCQRMDVLVQWGAELVHAEQRRDCLRH